MKAFEIEVLLSHNEMSQSRELSHLKYLHGMQKVAGPIPGLQDQVIADVKDLCLTLGSLVLDNNNFDEPVF